MSGAARYGRHVWDWLAGVRLGWVVLGMAGEVRSGLVRSGELWQGEAGRGMAGKAGVLRRGSVCHVKERLGVVLQGTLWQARYGKFWLGGVRRGMVRCGRH